jgi:hypothetical protein
VLELLEQDARRVMQLSPVTVAGVLGIGPQRANSTPIVDRSSTSITVSFVVMGGDFSITAPGDYWITADTIVGERIASLRGKLGAAPMQRDNTAVPGLPSSLPTSVVRVAASALITSARYRPAFYCGQLTLFTPARRDPDLPSLVAIWRKHAVAVSVVETGGDHSTMLAAPNAEATAASLTRCLCASSRS